MTKLNKDTFVNQKDLKDSDISNNKLKMIPSTLFRNLTNLEDLELKSNQLRTLYY